MKKFLSLVAIATLSFGYEGCGVDKKEALNALSQSIYVNINNQFSKNEEVHKGLIDFFSKSVTNTTSQSSNLTLKNVKFTTKKGEVCAIVDKKDVLASAKQTLNYLDEYSINNLPSNFEEKQKEIKSLLSKIAFTKAILNLNKNQIKKLNKLEKQLKDLANKGAVVFNLNIPYAEIKISSQDKLFTPSDTILLPAGKYSYKITANGYEEKIGEFSITPQKEIKISATLESLKDKQSAKEKSEYFSKSTELDISYGYAITADHNPEWDAQKRIEIRNFKNYGIYKLGFGVLAGTDTHWTAKAMDELELVVSARLQFPELFDTQFNVGSVAFLPYVGVEGGWDFYKYIDNLNQGDSVSANDITTVVRGTLGTTILIHKQFGFNIQYAHDFMEKKDHIVSAGIVMDF